jgi:hypothetical protein
MKLKLPTNYRQVIDEFGCLQEKIESAAVRMKPVRDREKELRERILGWAENLPDDQSCSVEGGHYAVAVSERRIERTIKSMRGVLAALGETTFLKSCSFPFKALKEHLLPDEMARLLTESPTGPREVTATPRVALMKRKAA